MTAEAGDDAIAPLARIAKPGTRRAREIQSLIVLPPPLDPAKMVNGTR